MEYGVSLNINETLQEVIEKSREIERLGFDYIWIADTASQRYAPIVAAAVAEETKRVKIGVGVLSPFLYVERQIANAVKTLTEIYGERFEVCLGPGDLDQLRRAGINPPKARNIPKLVLESKDRIETELRKQGLKTPIWIGSQGREMLKISKFFHGALLNYAHPTLIEWAREIVKAGGGEKVKVGVYAPSYVYTREEQDVLQLLKMAASVVALGLSKSVMAKTKFQGEIIKARAKLQEGLPIEKVMGSLPEELLEKFAIHMPAWKLKEYIAKLEGIGIEQIVFGFPQNLSNKIIGELAESLFQLVKHSGSF
ncbi:MAG: LLM class flavin-dependent oxidoreductase [Candidatus Bathyarchaeales archaeon]